MKYYIGNIVPEPNVIFVFGSNLQGIHGAGSAKCAVKLFGAKYGQNEGLQGSSYALPTTDLMNHTGLPLSQITENIKKLYNCARENPNKNFKIAYRNQLDEKTLCHYTGKQLMQCFINACDGQYFPGNVIFSFEWYQNFLSYELFNRQIKKLKYEI